MFFGKKRKYKLPKFPDTVRKTFERLATDLDEGELAILRMAIIKHFEVQQSEESPTNHYSDLESEEVINICNYLLDIYPSRSEQHRKIIVGAVRYAASTHDPFCDETFASGMTDDKQVLNYVLEELDIHDRYLTLY